MLKAEDYFERIHAKLALQFREAINLEIETLLEFPESAPVVHPRGLRRRLLTGFKFKIIYIIYIIEEELGLLTILSVRHTSQADEFLDQLLD